MKSYTHHSEVIVPAPLEEVFEFFSNAENLLKLTPSQLKFRILTPLPIHMAEGALIDYRLSILGVPMHWTSKITVWEPGVRFADEQLRGPYKSWVHEHAFEACDGGTKVIDNVDYAPPGAFLSQLVQTFFVGPQVAAIFKYRNKVIKEIFG